MRTNHVEQHSWREHFLTGFAIVLFASLLTLALNGTTWMNRLEMANLDAWISFQAPPSSSQIAVVAITDAEYRDPKLFHGISPLSPALVTEIICAIEKSGAKVIAIDLDTSDWTAGTRDHVRQNCAGGRVSNGSRVASVVWAIGGSQNSDGTVALDSVSDRLPEDCFAAPAVVPDQDGVVRRSPEVIRSSRSAWPTMASVIAAISQGKSEADACASKGAAADDSMRESNPLINFHGGVDIFPHLTSSAVVGASGSANGSTQAGEQPWQNANPLKNKIVVLGGTYRAARDRYTTPVGAMDGLDIVAHDVVTELPHGRIGEVSRTSLFLIDFFMGCALVTLTYLMRSWWAVLALLVIVPSAAFVSSLIVYSSSAKFFSFMPVLLGVLAHEIMMQSWHHRQLRREVQKLRHFAARSQS